MIEIALWLAFIALLVFISCAPDLWGCIEVCLNLRRIKREVRERQEVEQRMRELETETEEQFWTRISARHPKFMDISK